MCTCKLVAIVLKCKKKEVKLMFIFYRTQYIQNISISINDIFYVHFFLSSLKIPCVFYTISTNLNSGTPPTHTHILRAHQPHQLVAPIWDSTAQNTCFEQVVRAPRRTFGKFDGALLASTMTGELLASSKAMAKDVNCPVIHGTVLQNCPCVASESPIEHS